MALESRKSARIEDPGADLLERVSAFWTRFDRIVLGALGAVVVIGAGTFFTLRSRATQEDAAAGHLAEANAIFWQGDYARAQQRAKQVSDQYGATPSGIDAYRLQGDAAYWTGDFKMAADQYKKYLEHRQRGLLADAVRRSLAYAYESNGQYALAMPLYDQLVGTFDRESSAEFLMAAARCANQLHQATEATRRLKRIADEFGDTSQMARAREMLGELATR